MPLVWLMGIVVLLGALGYVLGRRRALASADGDRRALQSLPHHYGLNALVWVIVPPLLVLAAWLLIQPSLILAVIRAGVPEAAAERVGEINLIMADIEQLGRGLHLAVEKGVITAEAANAFSTRAEGTIARLASIGVALDADNREAVIAGAKAWRQIEIWATRARDLVVLTLALGGFAFVLSRSHKDFRARQSVELGVKLILIGAASIAILTTIGIVLSMLFESMNFFRQYPAMQFFFGLDWSPNFRGNSDLGVIPLLWGTLYISVIALLVAVPIGLFSAIYLWEYAGPRLRAIAKPLLEILAGIPTIVYGLFALIAVGPFLRDYFAQPLGLGNSGSSVMTAGLVMGIMLIPFVSSLSDDIINSVPQAMRDGSFGIGATHSETIKQVVLPAALPGIVGAILLAASRAIGETMIVVLGAGAAARMSLNPFEAMTTVTVKIVSQLTGDTDFNSPETLVAFALGLTLFVITLGLNVFALGIVRRYREQYE